MDPRLLHDVDHDLATILVLVAAIRGDGGLDDASRRRLTLIEREVDHLRALIDSPALDPRGRPDTHTVAPATHPDARRDDGTDDVGLVEIRAVAAGVVEPRRSALPTAVELAAGPPVWAGADPTALRRVLTNLVDNAVRAAGPRGRVEVAVVAGPPVTVRVTDDGPGWGRGPEGGAGLGLGIVDVLARELGAEVTVADGRPAGTVVEVSLPSRRAMVAVPRQRLSS